LERESDIGDAFTQVQATLVTQRQEMLAAYMSVEHGHIQ
jgi:hypothetical protein